MNYQIILDNGLAMKITWNRPGSDFYDVVDRAKSENRFVRIDDKSLLNPNNIVMIIPDDNVSVSTSSIVIPKGNIPPLNG